VFLDLTAGQLALRDELRDYFTGLISPAERAAMLTDRHGAVYREVVRRMGRDGWLGVGWPAEYGGRGPGQAGKLAALHDRVRSWAAGRTGADGRPLLDRPDVRRALGAAYASMRVNELLNWQVAAADTVDVADASVTKVYSSVRLQQLGQLLEEVVARHGDPAEEETAQLRHWLDIQAKRNTVLTFGGGANEIQRELIATVGLGLPRVPR